MAQVLDLEKFTFVGDTLKGVGELTFELMLDKRNALSFVTTYGNIKVEKEVGFIGEGGLVGKKSQGCDPVAQAFNASTRLVKWTPEDWEVLLHLCYKDMDGTIAEYERKNGIKKADFTQSDYEAIVEMLLARALNKFLWRLLWFNDKNAANFEDGGVITNGVDVDYFNIIDGYWKQIFAQVSANAKQRVDAESTGWSNDDYTSADAMTGAQAKAILDKMYFTAPLVLRNQPDKVFYVTQNLYDAYDKYLTDSSARTLESVESAFVNGLKVLKIHGVEVIAMPEWDEHIRAFENNEDDGVFNMPYRALFTAKSALGAGFDKESDFDSLEVWYDRDTRKVKIEAMGNGDAKLLHPEMFMAAY